MASADAQLRSLKQAKVRFHPDKAQGSLEQRVRAEEVSKLLNAWDVSRLRQRQQMEQLAMGGVGLGGAGGRG